MLLATALLVGPAGSVAAQPQRATPAEHQARLAEALDLNAAQSELVQKVLDETPSPGALWTLAAELAPTLTDAQKDRLFARPERRARPGREARAERPRRERPRRARPERSDADREAHRAAMQQAMTAALGLTDRQAEQLDALREEHRARREARRAERQARRDQGQRAERGQRPARTRRAEPGQVPAEIAEILTDEQEAIWAVHQGLSRRMHAHHGRRHGGRR